MRHARQVAKDHAEAMIKGHGDAETVAMRKAHALSNPKTVVEDIVMRKHRPFRKARRPRGVLNIDGVIEFKRHLPFGKLLGCGSFVPRRELIPIQHAAVLFRAQKDNASEIGKFLGF